MAAKRTSSDNGCTGIVALVILVLTLAWPLLVFHRHWNTTETVGCTTDPAASGCTYNWNTGESTGTGTETTAHSAISSTGWIVEAVWVGALGGLLVLGVAGSVSSARKKGKGAVSSGDHAAPHAPGKLPAGHNVVDPSPSAGSRNSGTLIPDQVVCFAALDESSRQLLARAQRAINDVLTCKVYAENQLKQTVTESMLRSHEWSIAVSLRELTSLRAEQARTRRAHAAESPGPLTKAVLKAQQDVLQQKLTSVESLVKALENYATRVKAADLARLDWEAAAELAKLNPRFTNLVAGTAADELHLQEVQGMTEEATSFRDSLLQVNVAAEPLLLPDGVG